MADEIKTETPVVEEKDENVFQHSESVAHGCKTGEHVFQITSLEPLGNKTVVKLECSLCGAKSERSEYLNVNEMIAGAEPVVQTAPSPVPAPVIQTGAAGGPPPETQKQSQVSQPVPSTEDYFTRKKEAEKQEDSFWESIKKSK